MNNYVNMLAYMLICLFDIYILIEADTGKLDLFDKGAQPMCMADMGSP